MCVSLANTFSVTISNVYESSQYAIKTSSYRVNRFVFFFNFLLYFSLKLLCKCKQSIAVRAFLGWKFISSFQWILPLLITFENRTHLFSLLHLNFFLLFNLIDCIGWHFSLRCTSLRLIPFYSITRQNKRLVFVASNSFVVVRAG